MLESEDARGLLHAASARRSRVARATPGAADFKPNYRFSRLLYSRGMSLRSSKPLLPNCFERRGILRLLLVVILFFYQRLEVDHGMELLGGVAKEGLEVADKPVDVALARRLVDDVLVVVVAQAARQLLVVHLGLVFPQPPSSGDLRKQEMLFVVSSNSL